MFNNLQKRWNVSGWKFLLIFSTFAVGGSLCGFLGRKLLALTMLSGIFYVLAYIVVITLLWPLCVLLISIPLGQFAFFKNYIRRMLARMQSKKAAEIVVPASDTINIAIFASGAGTNAANIIRHFSGTFVKVKLVVCNMPGAGVIGIATAHHIPVLMVDKAGFYSQESCLPELAARSIDWVILAGFLWKIPAVLVAAYPLRMVNIHPALLPKFGGKGMYGKHVHAAVIAAGETQSGISIHFVDEIYDHGALIEQAVCEISSDETPETLATKIHQLEQKHFPVALERLLKKQNHS